MRKAMISLAGAIVLAALTGAAPPADAGFDGFSRDFIEGVFRLQPEAGVQAGRHEYDGRAGDVSDSGLAALADYYRRTIARGATFDDARLTKEQRFERDYVVAEARKELFWLTDADMPHRNPTFYIGLLDPDTYVNRPYASPETRLKAFTAFLRTVPTTVASARANLRMPMPATFIDHGVKGFNGLAEFYVKDAAEAFASVKDPKLQADYRAAAGPASAAVKGLADWFEQNRATATADYALGPERFRRMLKETELVDLPLDQVEAIGRADLKRNQDALKAACATYLPGGAIPACIAKMSADKPEGGVVTAARKQLAMLKQFVIDKDIVSIPGTEQALVEEAPAYQRQNFAYIKIPGPFEKGMPSVYHIAPPDPTWSAKVQADYVPGKAQLLFTSVHEVWPGHFLNFLHANRSSFLFGRVFVGYAYAEGWAHYTEEMMWDAGLGNGDAEAHVGQLVEALLRDVRFLSAIGLHTQGWTVERSRRFFLDEAYQDEGNARQQAARGTYDPAYLNYTLGKLMIRRLREDWTSPRGGRQAWKQFHDAFLSYGGPPIPLVRQQMLGGEAKAVF